MNQTGKIVVGFLRIVTIHISKSPCFPRYRHQNQKGNVMPLRDWNAAANVSRYYYNSAA